MKDQDPEIAILARLLAMTAATAEIMKAMIATHPEPTRLQEVWQQRIADTLDAEMETPPFGVNTYKETYLENMKGISQNIAQAVHAVQRPK